MSNYKFNIIKKRYPFQIQGFSSVLFTALFVGLVILCFEFLGFKIYAGNKLYGALGFAFVSFICILFCNYFFKMVVLKRRIKKWVVGYEVLYIIGLILFISILNLVFVQILSPQHVVSAEYVIKMILFTFIIGFIPGTLIPLVKYNIYLQSNLNLLIGEEKSTLKDREITIMSNLPSGIGFSVDIDTLLFIESVKNNVHVHYLEDGAVKMASVRNSISNVNEQLEHTRVFRCHRSYLINLNNIAKADGNSNGYKVYLKDYKKNTIPVSRSYVPDFLKLFH